jgi:amidohydrolase
MRQIILEQTEKIKDKLLALRAYLHRHPELGYQEHDTQELMTDRLSKLGLRVEKIDKTGLVATLEGNLEGKTLAFKANMDGVAVEDKKDVPYRSENKGVGHLCGHDVEMAWLYGIASIFSCINHPWHGNLKFIFQPNEERAVDQTIASLKIIETGIFDSIDALVEVHPFARLGLNQILVAKGMTNAGSGRYKITITGPGGHAGLGRDLPNLNVVAAYLIQEIEKSYSPKNGGLTFLNTTSVTSTDPVAFNSLPTNVTIRGTIRRMQNDYDSYKRQDKILRRFFDNRIKKETLSKFPGVEIEVDYIEGTPPTLNDDELRILAEQTWQGLGIQTINKRICAGSDLGFYTIKTGRPCLYGLLGSSTQEMIDSGISHHSPFFDVDESVIPQGVIILANFAHRYLNGGYDGR